MSRSLFRFSPFPRILLPMLAGMMALAVSRVQSQAEEADHQPALMWKCEGNRRYSA